MIQTEGFMITTLLTWIGAHASKALPIGLVIGIAFPPIASSLQPILALSITVPLVIALARVDWQQQLDYLKRWQLMLALVIWVLVVCPVSVWLLLLLIPIHPSLDIAAVMVAAAPPVTACAAIALFLRLDVAIVVVTTVLTMLVVPLILPLLSLELLNIQIQVPLFELSLRLAGFIFVAFSLALITKKLMGTPKIQQHAEIMDGIAVIFISFFIIGVMDGVTAIIIEQPLYIVTTLLMSFIFILFLQVISAAAFWSLPRKTSLAIAMMCGNCNMGLMYLVLADQSSIDVLLFFSIGQIPMYVLPALQTPLYQRLLAQDTTQTKSNT